MQAHTKAHILLIGKHNPPPPMSMRKLPFDRKTTTKSVSQTFLIFKYHVSSTRVLHVVLGRARTGVDEAFFLENVTWERVD